MVGGSRNTGAAARPGDEAVLTELVAGAADGDEASWEALVRRFTDLVASVARGSGLSRADASEVEQVTWVRLAEHIRTIGQPERIGAWLVTTTRRESWRVRRQSGRYVTIEASQFDRRLGDEPSADEGLLERERRTTLAEAMNALPERQRSLLSMLMRDPDISYVDLAASLDMPIGSIGPTRARAVLSLREHMTRAGLATVG